MAPRLAPPEKIPASNDLRGIVAFHVRTKRCQLGWSQETLALNCGLDRTYVSAVERKRWNISLSNLEAIAHALELPPWTLLVPIGKDRQPIVDHTCDHPTKRFPD